MKKILICTFIMVVSISLVFSGCTKENDIGTEDNESATVEGKIGNIESKISEFSDLRQSRMTM